MKGEILSTVILLVVSLTIHAQSYVPDFKYDRVKVSPVAPLESYASNLKDIRLHDGSQFKNAMEKDAA
jgi:hypothetical protein